MVGKIRNGSNFRRLIKYITNPEKEQWREGRHLSDLEANAVIKDMEFVAERNRKVRDPVYHLSVSWSPTDDPSKEQMLEVADRVLKELGMDNNQALIVAHKDTEHQHIHIAVNRVEMAHFKAVDRWGDRHRLRGILKDLELEKGWEQTPGSSRGSQGQTIDEKKLTVKVNEELARIGFDNPNYKTVRERALEIRGELGEQSNWKSFDDKLAGKGLWAEKLGAGMVITDGAMRIKASSLGRSFGKGHLEKRFGQSFDEYVKRRELKISVKAGMKEVADWTSAKERLDLENAKVGMEKALRMMKVEAWKIDKFDEHLNEVKQAIDKGFDQTFSDPADAKRDFNIIVERDGLDKAHAELMANPRTFGKVKSEEELVNLSDNIRKVEKVYDAWNQYLDHQIIRDPVARAEKREQIKEDTPRLKKSLPVIRQQLRQAMRQTEAGYSVSRGAEEVIAVSRAITSIMNNYQPLAKKIAGRGMASFKNDLAKQSEAGKALVQITDQSMKVTRVVLKIGNALKSGGASLAQSGIRHAIYQHRQVALQKQRERGDFSR